SPPSAIASSQAAVLPGIARQLVHAIGELPAVGHIGALKRGRNEAWPARWREPQSAAARKSAANPLA
ncbi:MAG: hypothetical protein J5I93_26985, partial [Pirellulaceae bacterium]|nr:hypothetical protein [Pirellulaceae bacterium]